MSISLPDLPQLPVGPYVVLDDQIDHTVRYYSAPIAIVTAYQASEVFAAFERLADYQAQGYYLAGYCAYEMGYALEPKLAPLMPDMGDTPLLCFGVFSKPQTEMPPPMRYGAVQAPDLDFHPQWNAADYAEKFRRVIDYIKAGDVYQINLTFPLEAQYTGSAHRLYAAIRRRQGGRYGGIVSLGGPEIISFSPELFFQKTDAHMTMRPMKGTTPRALNGETDKALKIAMREDEKSQAENLMIVDLLRNDLSRIAETGSVNVPELFALETYPTLHQMTSRVEARLQPDTAFIDIFKGLFPCGSVTGAPKIRAMEIIDELETGPRGAYCGAMGYIDPDGTACFNVGIRTLVLENNRLTYAVGSGVVLDSVAEAEYQECLLKADILKPSPLTLIETFLWDGDYIRGEAHLARLAASAQALSYPCPLMDIQAELSGLSSRFTQAQRIRLTLSAAGRFEIRATPFTPFRGSVTGPVKIALSRHPLSPQYQTLDHKVSRRDFYDGERARVAALSGADEVIFYNSDGDICEGSFTSIFSQKQGQLMTPSLNAGLLPGVFRAEMIATGQAVEARLSLDDLRSADALFVGNSLRGLLPARWITDQPV